MPPQGFSIILYQGFNDQSTRSSIESTADTIKSWWAPTYRDAKKIMDEVRREYDTGYVKLVQ